MSETQTPPKTLQYRIDGPDDASVLILGPSLGTTWHRPFPMGHRGNRRRLRGRAETA
ncbi:hypothetical protein [Streptomyces sp. NPDC000880]